MVCTVKNCFSPETVRRLTVYLQSLKRVRAADGKTISSKKISKLLNVSPEQFRKDLSYFGEFGKRGVGYEIEPLIKVLENILGVNRVWNVAVIGVGRLGSSLINYHGFADSNINVSAAFDIDTKKVGSIVHNVKISNLASFEDVVKEKKIEICIISIPNDSAQAIAEMIVKAGVKAILNFSPIVLNVPENIYIQNIDMLSELVRLTFFLNNELTS